MIEPLRVLLNGARGRMGQMIQAIAAEQTGVKFVALTDAGDDPASLVPGCDVVIDFSVHEVTLGLAEAVRDAGKAMVLGTTGHSPEEREQITACAQGFPMVWAGNFSVGVNLLYALARQAAEVLREGYDIEVIEAHHRQKRDAPSGTAEDLVRVLRDTLNRRDDVVTRGRNGVTGERPASEIGVHAIRGGQIVGEHTALFAGSGDRIEITHRAADRRIFAEGALRAARWVGSKRPGVYGMDAVLGMAPVQE